MATSLVPTAESASLPSERAAPPSAASVAKAPRSRTGLIIAAAVAHVLLALAMRAFPTIATVHAASTVLAAAIIAASTRRIGNLAAVAAYLTGAEVLWRMCHAGVFWEFGKYSIALVFMIGLLRIRVRRNRALPLAYFGLLIPSIMLTMMALTFDQARQEVSFTLSGPLAMALAVLFFSNVRLTAQQLSNAFFAFILPVLGVSTLVFQSVRAHSDVEFVNAANTITSGGFGPNQVSAVLGLGLMFVVLFLLTRRLSWTARIPLFILAVAFAAQTALTFARGGLAAALAGVAAAMFVLMRGNRRARVTVLIIGVLAVAAAKLVVEPQLAELTNGEIDQRFSSTKSSGRDIFVKVELELFAENPVLGVGPGMGTYIRRERGMFFGASHTEYSRMLAEHGLLGALSLACLIALGFRAVKRAPDSTARALSLAMVIWAALFLLVYSTRLATPAFVFGLAFATPYAARPPPKKLARR